METISINIPGKFKRSQSTQLSSLILSSSYFCASSLHHPRNVSGVTFSVSVDDDPSMERKLSRTRQMSETIRSGPSQCNSRRMTTIPTVSEDITSQWVTMLINQRQLKCGKSPLDPDVLEGLTFQVHDCKKSVGEFSSTYKVGKSKYGTYAIVQLLNHVFGRCICARFKGKV